MLHLVRRFAVRIALVALLGLMAAGFALPAGQASARTSEPTDSQILCAFYSQQFSFWNHFVFTMKPGPERDAAIKNRDDSFDGMLTYC